VVTRRSDPERRCVACGVRAPKRVLRRHVLVGERVIADPEQRRPGRGAYVCSDACLARAIRTRAFHRAFRRAVVTNGLTTDPSVS
jgi:predicted RNA-binding protein YlxR (DUF448 family)